VKFQVFENGQLVENFQLFGAYLFGNDSVAIRRAGITCKNGLIECKKPNSLTAGLGLLWNVKDAGNLYLVTTCLPERKQPYNLNLELARAKIKQIINKREDWGFFDGKNSLEQDFDQARKLLVEAIKNISDSSAAAKLADKALEKAVAYSQKLSLHHAETSLKNRTQRRGFGRGCFSCRIYPSRIDQPEYCKRLLDIFKSVNVPVNWAQIEKTRGNYDFSQMDKCIGALTKKRVALSAGPLLCFSPEYLPEWLKSQDPGFEAIRELAYRFVSEILARYSNKIHTWRVVRGLNALNHFNFDFEQILEMTRAANMAVKAVSSRAVKIVEITQPWGEYYAAAANTIPPVVYMDMIVQGGINFDAFGVEMQFGQGQGGMYNRDMMHISAILDLFAPLAKPLYVTGVEIPSRSPVDDNLHYPTQPWDQAEQATWIQQFFKIALGKPYVASVSYSHLTDREGNRVANSGLLNEKLQPKKSYKTLKNLHDSIFSRHKGSV